MTRQRWILVAGPVLMTAAFAALGVNANKDVSVTPLFKTGATWDGAAISYPEGAAEVSASIIEIAPGGETGWHLHTAPSLAYMIEGEIEVHLKDGRVKHLREGEAFAEVVNTLHNGKNLGSVPARLVVFYTSASGATLTLTEAEAALRKL